MSRYSLLVTLICTLATACAMVESKLGTGSGAGAGTGNAGGVSATPVAGLSTQNGGNKRSNEEVGKPNHDVPVVAEVGSFNPGYSGYGEEEKAARVFALRVPGISSAQNGGVGTGTGTGTANLNLFTAQGGVTGQGSGSSVGK